MKIYALISEWDYGKIDIDNIKLFTTKEAARKKQLEIFSKECPQWYYENIEEYDNIKVFDEHGNYTQDFIDYIDDCDFDVAPDDCPLLFEYTMEGEN